MAKIVSACLFSGIVAFVFLHLVELALSFWLGRRIRLERVLYYLLTYAIMGVAFGACLGTAHALLARFGKNLTTIQPERMFVALGVSGMQLSLAFLILNAGYLRQTPILSTGSLISSIGLICFFVGSLFLVYKRASPAGARVPIWTTMSSCGLMALPLVFFHAFVFSKTGRAEIAPPQAVALTFAFMALGTLTALMGMKVAGLIAGRRGHSDEESVSRRVLFATTTMVIVALALALWANRYRPMIAEDGGASPPPEISDRPNIIILVLDTVRQNRLSTYGCERETSPNISKLAEESLVFDAYSTISWTLASHAAIVTGLHPTETGTGFNGSSYIDPRNRTIAEILRENGYSTAAVIANNFVLSHLSGFSQGFDYYYAKPRETQTVFPFFASYLLEKFMADSPAHVTYFFERAENINKRSLRWLNESARKPFFLLVNYMDAHDPYAPPHPYDRRWYKKVPPPGLGAGLWLKRLEKNVDAEGRGSEAEREYLLSQYDGEIAYLDAQIGRFLEELRRIGVYDESLIILTADHGDFFGEHGLFRHPLVVYQEVLRVPLIVKPPAGRGEKPGRIPTPVSLVDLFHSILEYVTVPHDSRAGSFDLFKGERSPILSEGHFTENSPAEARFGAHLYSLIRDNYKVIYASNQMYEFYT